MRMRKRRYPEFKRWLGVSLVVLACTMIIFAFDSPVSVQAEGPVQLRLLQSDTNRIVLELEVSDYATQTRTMNGSTFTVISVSGLAPSGKPGTPQLPIKGTMVGIPPGAQATISILADDSRQTTLASPVLPAPTDRTEFDP